MYPLLYFLSGLIPSTLDYYFNCSRATCGLRFFCKNKNCTITRLQQAMQVSHYRFFLQSIYLICLELVEMSNNEAPIIPVTNFSISSSGTSAYFTLVLSSLPLSKGSEVPGHAFSDMMP
ncbi:uncharacterized protein EAE98_006956 [Botrytis deweyae]|uniref:Uncharacterized protein n=1 Tax=Botrytis deweyae TaxID=2478750 RepID=A0ABQ7IJ69_9HELO|nr:uncharacterized protein EAE98_006956 [Botrytis deweyae]KAF7925731.1 hypothetical protein EAE98_006956 [Botrytis deweyae]